MKIIEKIKKRKEKKEKYIFFVRYADKRNNWKSKNENLGKLQYAFEEEHHIHQSQYSNLRDLKSSKTKMNEISEKIGVSYDDMTTNNIAINVKILLDALKTNTKYRTYLTFGVASIIFSLIFVMTPTMLSAIFMNCSFVITLLKQESMWPFDEVTLYPMEIIFYKGMLIILTLVFVSYLVFNPGLLTVKLN